MNFKNKSKMKTNLITKNSFNPISISILIVLAAVETALYYFQIISVPVYIGLLILSVLLVSSIQIADQWEKAVVLRMGKYNGLKGPGLFVIIPIIDRVINYIDQRITGNRFQS